MFRQEKPVLPFNEISHLTGESLSFAINLRKKTALEAKKTAKQSLPPPVDTKRNIIDGKQVKDEYAVKETNCINSSCLNNNYTYAIEFQERSDLLSRMEELTQELEQHEASLIESNEHYQSILKINHDYSNKITELSSREVDAKRRKNDAQKQQIQLEKEIRLSEKLKTKLIMSAQQQQQMQSAAVSGSEIVFSQEETKKNSASLKHNGVYAITETGAYAWTCCHASEYNSDGCIDDHSVSERSSLPLVKNYYSNQLTVKHPLQHGSELFIENSIRRKLKSEAIVLNKNTTKIPDTIHPPNQNHIESLYLGKGSTVDYFSVHKPASRVLAMEAYTNKSIRTTDGLLFGTTTSTIHNATTGTTTVNSNNNNNVKKNTSNEFITPGVSVTSHRSRPSTACGIVHRSSITDIHPHLHKNIIKHKIEEKLTAPDFSKPPLPFASYNENNLIHHESTKHYSSYSRPYSHINMNHTNSVNRDNGHGIFTQSIVSSVKASTSKKLQKQRPSTAHPTGFTPSHLAHTTYSMESNVTWGQRSPSTEFINDKNVGERGLSGDAESIGSYGRFSSQGDSRDSEDGHCEVNFAPSFLKTPAVTSTISSPGCKNTPPIRSKSQPHYLLPKSLSGNGATSSARSTQKASIIGKQRAAPHRTKLTPNRPLASADAFKLFY